MNEGRLKLVSTQTKRRRKFTAISNLLIRERHADYDGGLDRERVHVQLITKKHELQLKKSLVDLRSYSKCLRRLKQTEAGSKSTTYFRDDVKSDIDAIIKENHPRARRFRRTQKMLENGKSNGQLICPVDAMKRLDTILGFSPIPSITRPDDQTTPQRSSSKLVLPPINAFQSRDQIKKTNEMAFQQVQRWIGNIQIKDPESATHLPPLPNT